MGKAGQSDILQAFLASTVAALRAVRIDAMAALREE
jgi:hypothetical protein